MQQRDAPSSILVYDADCDFCCYWIRYCQRLTGRRVRYQAFQGETGLGHDRSEEEHVHAIQLLGPDGQRYLGAHAAFRLLAYGAAHGFWLWLYQRIPGFAQFAEACYELVLRHRTGAARAARFLWGRERYPDDYRLVSWLFLRMIALIYLSAFASLAVQITALVGPDGLLPVTDYTPRGQVFGLWGGRLAPPTPTSCGITKSSRA